MLYADPRDRPVIITRLLGISSSRPWSMAYYANSKDVLNDKPIASAAGETFAQAAELLARELAGVGMVFGGKWGF